MWALNDEETDSVHAVPDGCSAAARCVCRYNLEYNELYILPLDYTASSVLDVSYTRDTKIKITLFAGSQITLLVILQSDYLYYHLEVLSPENVIGTEAFSRTVTIEVKIPLNVRYICNRAFAACSALKKVYFPIMI